jgi:hypothetical protein
MPTSASPAASPHQAAPSKTPSARLARSAPVTAPDAGFGASAGTILRKALAAARRSDFTCIGIPSG